MTLQPIDPGSAALYLTAADLARRGLTPESLTLRRALELALAAFARLGVSCTGGLELEVYPGRDGVLLFARLLPSGRRQLLRRAARGRRPRRAGWRRRPG